MRKDDRDDEPTGNGAVLGVLFAIALTALGIYLMQQMRDSATMLDCAFTKDPKCRALIKD